MNQPLLRELPGGHLLERRRWFQGKGETSEIL